MDSHVSEQIYYNIQYRNNGDNDINFSYDESRLQALLVNPKEWEMKVQKVVIPSNSIPITIADMEIGSTTNETNWYVGYKYGSQSFMKQLIYYSTDDLSPVPPVVLPNYRTNRYYYIWSINHLLEMVNIALASAWADLKLHAGISAPAELSCFFFLNTNTQKIELICPSHFWNGMYALLENQLYMNSRLHNYFYGWNDIIHSASIATAEFSIIIQPQPYNYNAWEPPGSTYPVYPTLPNYINMSQEVSFWSYWSTLRNFIFKSSYLPTIKEGIKTNTVSDTNTTSSATDQTEPTIFELSPDNQDLSNSRAIQFYFDQGTDRWISLNSEHPLKRINMLIFWQDDFLVEHSLRISTYQTVFIKLLFRRRHRLDKV